MRTRQGGIRYAHGVRASVTLASVGLMLGIALVCRDGLAVEPTYGGGLGGSYMFGQMATFMPPRSAVPVRAQFRIRGTSSTRRVGRLHCQPGYDFLLSFGEQPRQRGWSTFCRHSTISSADDGPRNACTILRRDGGQAARRDRRLEHDLKLREERRALS